MKTSESMRAMVANEESVPPELVLVWASKFETVEEEARRISRVKDHEYRAKEMDALFEAAEFEVDANEEES